MDNNNPNKPELPDASHGYGYGKPPKDKQFKKGKSGNPSGRPKKSSDSREIMSRVLQREYRIRDNGRSRSVTLFEALLLARVDRALRGDTKSQDYFLNAQMKPKTLTELMGNRPVFEFTEEEAARFTKEKLLDGMKLPDDDQEVL